MQKSVTTGANTTTTYWIYNGYKAIAEYQRANPASGSTSGSTSAPALTKTFLWDQGGELRAESQITSSQIAHYYPLADGNRNITDYLDSAGANVAHYQYDAYGNQIVKTGSKVDDFTNRFSTEAYDKDLGLIYYNFRYYNPQTGRWSSRDPIEERGGINLYAFVGNDGVNRWDKLGLAYVEKFEGRHLEIDSVIYGEEATVGGVNDFWIKIAGTGYKDPKTGYWVWSARPSFTEGVSERSMWSNTITKTDTDVYMEYKKCRQCAWYELHRKFTSSVPLFGKMGLDIVVSSTWEEKVWVKICADGEAISGNFTITLETRKGWEVDDSGMRVTSL